MDVWELPHKQMLVYLAHLAALLSVFKPSSLHVDGLAFCCFSEEFPGTCHAKAITKQRIVHTCNPHMSSTHVIH